MSKKFKQTSYIVLLVVFSFYLHSGVAYAQTPLESEFVSMSLFEEVVESIQEKLDQIVNRLHVLTDKVDGHSEDLRMLKRRVLELEEKVAELEEASVPAL
jgi:hypothetical protein